MLKLTRRRIYFINDIPFSITSFCAFSTEARKEKSEGVVHMRRWIFQGDRSFWSDGSVLYLEHSGGYTDVYNCQNLKYNFCIFFFKCFYNLLVIIRSYCVVSTQLSIFSPSTLVLSHNKLAITDLVQ